MSCPQRTTTNETLAPAPIPHGQVTEEDFIDHHANLSFGVKSDTDFRELVMNCWDLGGGGDGGDDGDSHLSAGVADVLRRANAPRRKFMVSYADGSQCVEDLPFSTEASPVVFAWIFSVLFMVARICRESSTLHSMNACHPIFNTWE